MGSVINKILTLLKFHDNSQRGGPTKDRTVLKILKL